MTASNVYVRHCMHNSTQVISSSPFVLGYCEEGIVHQFTVLLPVRAEVRAVHGGLRGATHHVDGAVFVWLIGRAKPTTKQTVLGVKGAVNKKVR